MADAYLMLAEKVLLDVRQPLTPRQMLDIGYAQGLVPWHLHGHTQHKTLQARLSEDVSAHPEGSKFFRTAPGQFFLKSLRHDPVVPDAYKAEFLAPPRRKELKREAILAIRATLFSGERGVEFVPLQQISRELENGEYVFRHWSDLQESQDLLPVHSFVVVHRNQEVLSYRSGKFRSKSDPLFGTRSIGFGGAVTALDVDLVFDSFWGIIGNGIRELVASIGLTRRLAEEARYRKLLCAHFATVVQRQKSNLRFVHVVVSYRCPDDFLPTKTALSLNDLRWVSIDHRPNDLSMYDPTSQFLFECKRLEQIAAPSGRYQNYG